MASTARPFYTIAPLILLAGFLSSCNGREWGWNQKISVEVWVDGRVVSGSSVLHVIAKEDKFNSTLPTGSEGEATIVDLGERGKLFALLGDGARMAELTLQDIAPEGSTTEDRWTAIMKFRGKKEVPARYLFPGTRTYQNLYPTLAAFTDLNNPSTVTILDPSDLSKFFGSGVSLRRIELEITDEPVTQGTITAVLPCLTSELGCFSRNQALPQSIRQTISDSSFRRRCTFLSGCG
ncbi:hypothetical protein [Mesorhizobium sp. CA7]|uniref:hypothetical protein n=1 Tax=Mesorhizobium sp. CA7 TaxID=588501 RepID=UPI001CCD9895|nr:hypothetical protein [Mesorhizobium sp. CA7]MBZ9817100.1 hypothetical protein [Mesorhizobium sp. CA7]